MKSELEAGYEIVHTMTDYYDGPLRGIADLDGVPHIYELDGDADSPSPIYRLSPISSEAFSVAVEDWAIWLRWERAFHLGLTTYNTHPALPEDAVRHCELVALLKQELVFDEARCVRARGVFRPISPNSADLMGWSPLQVRWSRIGPSAESTVDPLR